MEVQVGDAYTASLIHLVHGDGLHSNVCIDQPCIHNIVILFFDQPALALASRSPSLYSSMKLQSLTYPLRATSYSFQPSLASRPHSSSSLQNIV